MTALAVSAIVANGGKFPATQELPVRKQNFNNSQSRLTTNIR